MRTLVALSVLLASTAFACAKAPPVSNDTVPTGEAVPVPQPVAEPTPAPAPPPAVDVSPSPAAETTPAAAPSPAPAPKLAKNDMASKTGKVTIPRRPMKSTPRAKTVTSNVSTGLTPWGTPATPPESSSATTKSSAKRMQDDDPWGGAPSSTTKAAPSAKDMHPYD